MSLERFFAYPTETVEYIANVSDRYKYFYLATPKAASTTILEVLQAAEVDGTRERLPQYVHDRGASPLLSPLRSAASPEQILAGTRYFKFSYVRNPYTRILSAYLDKIAGNDYERARLLPTLGLPQSAELEFRDFLRAILAQRDSWRDIHWTTQTRLMQCNNFQYHFIGRYESFPLSFPGVLQRIGIPPSYYESSQGRLHATKAGELVAQYIGDQERELILTIYEPDFRNFGYGNDPSVAHL